MNKITTKVNIESDKYSKYINSLIDLRLQEKEYPISKSGFTDALLEIEKRDYTIELVDIDKLVNIA